MQHSHPDDREGYETALDGGCYCGGNPSGVKDGAAGVQLLPRFCLTAAASFLLQHLQILNRADSLAKSSRECSYRVCCGNPAGNDRLRLPFKGAFTRLLSGYLEFI